MIFQPFDAPVLRVRRAHNKSRVGCSNCKLRRVKCDEGRPRCLRCLRRNDICTFTDINQEILQEASIVKDDPKPRAILPALARTDFHDSLEVATIQRHLPGRTIVANGFNMSSQNFEVHELHLLRHFEKLTSTTIGSSDVSTVYSRDVVQLSIQHPHLLNGILAMSDLHLQHLSGWRTSTAAETRRLVFYWQTCLAEFGTSLPPRSAGDCADAQMVTATLVNGVAFCMIENTNSDTCWPFSSTPSSIRWLSLQRGIGIVFGAVQALGYQSRIKQMFEQSDEGSEAEMTVELLMDRAPDLAKLCGISTSTNQSNPYFSALKHLVPMMFVPCNEYTVFAHLAFIGEVTGDFIALLAARDHRALLVMCYWYAKISSYDCWWIRRRSMFEGAAICRYLAQEAGSEIRRLLDFPCRAFSLESLMDDLPRRGGQEEAQTLIPCPPM